MCVQPMGLSSAQGSLRELERQVPFSKSLLWSLQLEFFRDLGPEAWIHRGVPSYITSNPYTARQYAHMVVGFLRDGLASHAKVSIDSAHPIYIIDLGGGMGRFAYAFLKQFSLLCRGIPALEQLRIRYIFTDISQANIDFVRQHAHLRPFIEAGLLDFSLYHHAREEALHLQIADRDLSSDLLCNPAVLIANYYFNTVPHSLFRVERGVLQEGLITLFAPSSWHPSIEDSSLFGRFSWHIDYKPVVDPFHDDRAHADWNAILDHYRDSLEGHSFLFPLGGLQTLDFFRRSMRGGFLLLAGDQGYATLGQLKGAAEPKLCVQGSLSMHVNYHAIGLWFEQHGGHSYLAEDSDPFFQVVAAVFGGGASSCPETALSYREQIGHFDPKDYWHLVTLVQREDHAPSLRLLILLLKLGYYDPMNFHALFTAIKEQMGNATIKEKLALREAIRQAWEWFFPIHPLEGEFVMNLGVLFFTMELYAEALGFFQRALNIMGDHAVLYTNMGAAYLKLFNPEGASRCFEKAKSLIT